jgi:hypothetical protein
MKHGVIPFGKQQEADPLPGEGSGRSCKKSISEKWRLKRARDPVAAQLLFLQPKGM